MAISQIPALTAHISFLLWELTFGRQGVGRSTPHEWWFPRAHVRQTRCWQIYPLQMVISQIPTLTAHISLLLWELTFVRPSVGRSTPQWWFPRAHIRQTRCDRSTPPHEWQFPRVHIWQTRCWQIYHPSNGDFTDSCSDSSYFIPTLRAHIWQTRCWQIYPPQMAISQIPALTAHISFLLWEFIFGIPGVGKWTPLPLNGSLRDSYSESSYYAGQVLADGPTNSYNDASCCRQKQFLFILQADMYTLTDLGMIPDLYVVGRWNVP